MTFWLNTQICVEPSERRQQRWWDQRNICCFSKPRVVKYVGFPGFCDTDFWLPRGGYGTIQYDSRVCNAHKGHEFNREKEGSSKDGSCIVSCADLLRFDGAPYLSSFRNHSASISDRRRNIACNGRFRNVETRTNRCSFSKMRRQRHCAFGISPYVRSWFDYDGNPSGQSSREPSADICRTSKHFRRGSIYLSGNDFFHGIVQTFWESRTSSSHGAHGNHSPSDCSSVYPRRNNRRNKPIWLRAIAKSKIVQQKLNNDDLMNSSDNAYLY